MMKPCEESVAFWVSFRVLPSLLISWVVCPPSASARKKGQNPADALAAILVVLSVELLNVISRVILQPDATMSSEVPYTRVPGVSPSVSKYCLYLHNNIKYDSDHMNKVGHAVAVHTYFYTLDNIHNLT
jgi:hypothetical protein